MKKKYVLLILSLICFLIVVVNIYSYNNVYSHIFYSQYSQNQPAIQIDKFTNKTYNTSGHFIHNTSNNLLSTPYKNLSQYNPYLIIDIHGNYGRTNNQYFFLRDFLTFAKVQNTRAILPIYNETWESYINFSSINSFYPLGFVSLKEINETCFSITKLTNICQQPSPPLSRSLIFSIYNGSIDPYQYWDPYISLVHSTRVRTFSSPSCNHAYNYHQTLPLTRNNCTQYTSNANTFLNFDYTFNPQLFKDFYRHFKWNDIIINKVEKFFEYFRRKNFLTNLHYLALHIRLSDYGYILPFDQEIIDTIQKELTLLIHRYPKVFIFIATENHFDRRISLITQSFENLYMNVPDLISFKNPNERILFDMEVCTRADHFIGFDKSTLTFNVNMLRIFREKKLLNSSAFWPRLIPPQPNKEPLCCDPSNSLITCRYESTDCFPYINQPDYFRYYTRNIYNIEKPLENKLFNVHINTKIPITFQNIHLMIHKIRYIFALAIIWRRSIIMNGQIYSSRYLYYHFSNVLLSHLTTIIKKKIVNRSKKYTKKIDDQKNKCRDLKNILDKCNNTINPKLIDEILEGQHYPFDLFPLQLLNQKILPSVSFADGECLNFYLNGPSDDCIEVKITNDYQAFTFDWSYDPLLLLKIQQKFVFNYYDGKPLWLKNAQKFINDNPNILCVYIPNETNLDFSDAKFIINRELNLIGYNDTKLFIANYEIKSILHRQISKKYQSQTIFRYEEMSRRSLIGRVLFDTEVCHIANRFISPDDSIISFNINMMRWYGNGKQHFQHTSSYWPRISNKISKTHCCKYGSPTDCYSLETTNCYPKIFEKSSTRPFYYSLPIS